MYEGDFIRRFRLICMPAHTLATVSCLPVLLSHLLGHVTRLCYIWGAVNQSSAGTTERHRENPCICLFSKTRTALCATPYWNLGLKQIPRRCATIHMLTQCDANIIPKQVKHSHAYHTKYYNIFLEQINKKYQINKRKYPPFMRTEMLDDKHTPNNCTHKHAQTNVQNSITRGRVSEWGNRFD